MPAVTLLDHQISRTFDQLKAARRAGECTRIQHWRKELDALLDKKCAEIAGGTTKRLEESL